MVALRYGVLRSEGIAERAVFVIDKQGIVRYIDIHDINADPPVNPILRKLEEIEGKR
jgi:peroxiredoxin (alkyl hydroperoxide reductase subunit C)